METVIQGTLQRLKFLILLSAIAFLGCTKNSQQSCPLTVDVVTVLEKEQFQGITYTLVKRVSGIQDKVIVFQIFDQKPEFDDCNRDLIKPILEDSVETDRPVLEVLADVENKAMSITYGDEDVKQLVDVAFILR
jgi:hypothetical protein